MVNKNKLKDFFYAEKVNSKIIQVYEENKNLFDGISKNGHNTEDFEFLLQIKIYNYGIALVEEGFYSKALKIADEIENDLEKIKGKSKWYKTYYEGLIFLRGFTLGRNNQYKKSNEYFKILLKDKPNNDKFQNWYRHNEKYKVVDILNKTGWIALSITIIFIIISLLVKKHILFYTIEIICWIIYLITLIASFGWKKYIDKKKIVIHY